MQTLHPFAVAIHSIRDRTVAPSQEQEVGSRVSGQQEGLGAGLLGSTAPTVSNPHCAPEHLLRGRSLP